MASFQQERALQGFRQSMAKGAGAWALGGQAPRCGLQLTPVLPGHCGHMAGAGDWAEGFSAVGL